MYIADRTLPPFAKIDSQETPEIPLAKARQMVAGAERAFANWCFSLNASISPWKNSVLAFAQFVRNGGMPNVDSNLHGFPNNLLPPD
jgi:hypothetical protein